MLRVAVIDVECINKVHAATVAARPQARLVLVCNPLIEAARVLAEPLGAHTSADAAETFSADNMDAIVTGSPTPLHAERVLMAVRAGKATLCEEPVASSVEVARALTGELATFEHSPVMVNFQRRYDPSIAKVQRLVAEGRIRHIEQPVVISHNPASPSAEYLAQSGGMLKDMTIHDLGGTRFFLDEIVSVNAIGQKLDPALAGVDDSDGAVTTLRATSGMAAIIKNTRHYASGCDQKVEAFGSEDKVVAESLHATSVQVNDATGSVQQEIHLDFFLERYADAYRDELTAFADAVSNGSPVTPIVEGDVAALVLVEAAERSARSGQTVKTTK